VGPGYNTAMPTDLLSQLLTPQAAAAAALLIFLAGLSEGVGSHGVALLINRSSPARFALGIVAAALLFLLSAAVWMGALWLSVRLLYGPGPPLRLFFVAVSVAYGPLLLGALRLLPLLGDPLGWLLRLWSFALALAAIQGVTGLGPWQAAIGALAGSLLVEGARWLLEGPAQGLGLGHIPLDAGLPRRLPLQEPPAVIPGYEPATRAER
jgi:hypothetical protein